MLENCFQVPVHPFFISAEKGPHFQVFVNAHIGEDSSVFWYLRDAGFVYFFRCEPIDSFILKPDFAGCRMFESRDGS